MGENTVLRRMTMQDLAFADSLRALVGWNQTLQDWRRLLVLEPDGCFVAEWEGKPVATATTTRYSVDLAWIGMVLVHPDAQRHGIGRALLEHCIEYLNSHHIRCIKLDATPLGKTLYDNLGFRDEWNLTRWERSESVGVLEQSIAREVRPADWQQLFALDEMAFGVSRQHLIESLLKESFHALVLEEAGVVKAYGLLRRGARADYIGPVVAANPSLAPRLIHSLLADAKQRAVIWDIPCVTQDAEVTAQRFGFVRQRTLVRMVRGENKCHGTPSMQWAIADPSTG